jgi:hypothetical protein
MSDSPGASIYDSKTEEEALATGASFVKLWCDALSLSDSEEEKWRDKSEQTIEIYRGNKETATGRSFNILHSNVETICPALYNSTPVPDIRRRYADQDPIGKVISDLLDRAISYSIDTYDFDAVIRSVVKDGELPGRGVARVRYLPRFGEDGMVAYEEVRCDYVPWRYFRRGPGRTWDDVPWVAFGDFLTREALRDLCGDAVDREGKRVGDQVPLNYTAEKKQGDRAVATQESGIFRTALVWQIWDKESRRVISVCTDYPDAPLAVVDDPLQLESFFPTPRPYQPIQSTDSLVPIVPYQIYEDHCKELDDITGRIGKLIKQLRPRFAYASDSSNDFESWAQADDGVGVPITGIAHLIDGIGLDKAMTWFPLGPTADALKVLVEHRERIKQVIYEVTGIADILRGATNPNETLGAQQLKAQWGSLRIQNRQADVARYARDLFRLKAEIIAAKFSWQTLSQMTGITAPTAEQKAQAQAMLAQAQQQPPQQPGMPPAPPVPIPPGVKEMAEQASQEEIEQVLRNDIMRSYRIDVESDSTIRGDLTRNQQTMTNFLQGTAQFAQAMAPIVQQSPQSLPAVMEIYSAFARQFKLGRSAEAAMDNLAKSSTAPPPQPQPDPRADAEKAKTDAVKAKSEADIKKTALDAQIAERRHAMDMQAMDREDQSKATDFAMEQQKAKMQMVGSVPAAFMSPLNPMAAQ